MHVTLIGKDLTGQAKTVNWFIVAKGGDGPNIPTIPAIILAKRIIENQISLTGALPCVNLISLSDFLAELRGYQIEVY